MSVYTIYIFIWTWIHTHATIHTNAILVNACRLDRHDISPAIRPAVDTHHHHHHFAQPSFSSAQNSNWRANFVGYENISNICWWSSCELLWFLDCNLVPAPSRIHQIKLIAQLYSSDTNTPRMAGKFEHLSADRFERYLLKSQICTDNVLTPSRLTLPRRAKRPSIYEGTHRIRSVRPCVCSVCPPPPNNFPRIFPYSNFNQYASRWSTSRCCRSRRGLDTENAAQASDDRRRQDTEVGGRSDANAASPKDCGDNWYVERFCCHGPCDLTDCFLLLLLCV